MFQNTSPITANIDYSQYLEITCKKDCRYCTKLQEDINSAAKWEVDLLMACHFENCTILTFTQKKRPFKHDYNLLNLTLEPVASAKYLGVTLKSNFK